MTDKYLYVYCEENGYNDNILNAYVDLCNKYNIKLSNDDKRILDEYNIKY